ncbi:hypothetical protein K491DRAFT_184867 [Lophiostoma macrostomum CBS 122681]|uniref:Uncharacterized protein n=1 Tax=Lophiostoma macrostomum CBS 122681 TaxID=1314788 RepID=A0A6A6TVG9_9PLEO|nr:hypothetical protein K491DRAFT_184867 [Lophiostoma macrostomum CBS 122681]
MCRCATWQRSERYRQTLPYSCSNQEHRALFRPQGKQRAACKPVVLALQADLCPPMGSLAPVWVVGSAQLKEPPKHPAAAERHYACGLSTFWSSTDSHYGCAIPFCPILATPALTVHRFLHRDFRCLTYLQHTHGMPSVYDPCCCLLFSPSPFLAAI